MAENSEFQSNNHSKNLLLFFEFVLCDFLYLFFFFEYLFILSLVIHNTVVQQHQFKNKIE